MEHPLALVFPLKEGSAAEPSELGRKHRGRRGWEGGPVVAGGGPRRGGGRQQASSLSLTHLLSVKQE